MDDIRSWLNGNRNYDDGVALLLRYSQDTKLKRLYTIEGATDYKKKRLLEELQSLLTKTVKKVEKVQEQKETVVKRVASGHSKWPEQMDEVVKSLWVQWKPLFAEMNHLQARIYDVAKAGNTEESGKMAHRILDLDDECDAIYDKRDHYLQYGKLPVEHKAPTDVVVDPVKMAVALKNAERYVREYRGQLKKDAGNTRAAVNLKKWEERVKYYKQQLKME